MKENSAWNIKKKKTLTNAEIKLNDDCGKARRCLEMLEVKWLPSSIWKFPHRNKMHVCVCVWKSFSYWHERICGVTEN